MKTRFKALRTIANIFKIVAWLVLVGGIVGFIVTIAAKGVGFGLLFLLVSIIYFLSLYAFADLIYIFLSIEENVNLIASKLLQPVEQKQTPES